MRISLLFGRFIYLVFQIGPPLLFTKVLHCYEIILLVACITFYFSCGFNMVEYTKEVLYKQGFNDFVVITFVCLI